MILRLLRFFSYFLRAYPARSTLMVGLLVLAGMAEGVGVVTLIPLLEFAEGGGTPRTRLGLAVVRVLSTVGLEPTLPVLLAAIVLAMSAKAVLLWLAMRQVGFTVARVTRDLRLELIRRVFRADWSFFGSQPTGTYANAVSSEAVRAAKAYKEACTFLAVGFQAVVYVVLAAVISWQIMVFALVAGSMLALFLHRLVAMSERAGMDQTRVTRTLTGHLVDVLQGIKPVKAMAREDLVLPILEEEAEGLNRAQRQQVLAAESRKHFHEPVLAALLAIALFILLELGDEPLSSVLVLAFLFYRLMGQIHKLQGHLQTLVVGESAFRSLRDEIERARALEERRHDGRAISGIRKEIRFEGVRFAYDERNVLESLDLTIPTGTFVAISGESGSGKTTMADLLLGLREPDAGGILIDGVPLADISLSAWRALIGYVPQELLLFSDTILANVTLGDERLSRADAEEALRRADAWDFVSRRPDGMDGVVGEAGGMLSGGQRQRIAIARALVHRPALLILDEVTTALDPATEQEICNTLRALRGEVTIVSISHQPALRKVADAAYLMRHGRLVGFEAEATVGR